ncbi:hypothetical protein ACFL1H_07520 [Nanoarchaeota archaeon]
MTNSKFEYPSSNYNDEENEKLYNKLPVEEKQLIELIKIKNGIIIINIVIGIIVGLILLL